MTEKPCPKEENMDIPRPENEERADRALPDFLAPVLSLFKWKKRGTKADLGMEIQEILEEGEEHGLISSLEEKMINSILEFHDTCASEIMTPVAELVACELAMPFDEMVELVVDSGFTRIPVYQENLDKIVGIVHVKDLFRIYARGKDEEASIKESLRPVNFVSEKRPIVDLLREFQRTKIHIAVVQDEFGALRGLVTLEDILEEIVGEIDDEHDGDDTLAFRVAGEGTLVVHGWVDIEKLEEYYGLQFPEGPYESVGGLVVHLLGRLAESGDVVTVSGLRLEVLEASSRHIKRLQVTRNSSGD